MKLLSILKKRKTISFILVSLVAIILAIFSEIHFHESVRAHSDGISDSQVSGNKSELSVLPRYQQNLPDELISQSVNFPISVPASRIQPVCSESGYYFFFGNQLQHSPNSETTITQAPWKSVGVVHTNGDIKSGSTGVLIRPKYVLTAAHVLYRKGKLVKSASFSLAQHGLYCKPYGTISASKVWVPRCWVKNAGGSYNSLRTRACDLALIELTSKVSRFALKGAPSPSRMIISQQRFNEIKSLPAQATGYPSPNVKLPTDFSLPGRPPLTPYQTTDMGSFISMTRSHNSSTAIIKARIEGIAGMSGSPVWVRQKNIEELVGVLIGSPQENCESGENWVAAITPRMKDRLLSIMTGNSVRGMIQKNFKSVDKNLSPSCTTFP